jgi:hypothetical protein
MIDWKSMPGIRPPDIYGFDEIARFDRAFIKCLTWHQYPGPTAVNSRRMDWRGNPVKPSNRINGRLAYRRIQLMFLFGIKYKQTRFQTPIKDKHLGIPKEYYGALMVVNGKIIENVEQE